MSDDTAAPAAAPEATPAPEAAPADPVDYGGAELAAAMDGGGDGPAAPEPLNIDSLGDLGSQMVTMQINGEAVTLSVAEALKGLGKVESPAKMVGRRMTMLLSPLPPERRRRFLKEQEEKRLAEEAAKDAIATKVNNSFQKFKKVIGDRKSVV